MTWQTFGERAYCEYPPELDFSVPDPFAALLDSPSAQFIYLVELYPYNPDLVSVLPGAPPYGAGAYMEFDATYRGGTDPVYLSDQGFTSSPSASVSNRHFRALVDNPFQFDVSIVSGDEFGNGAPSYGSIHISNGDSALDDLAGYSWASRRVVIKAGGKLFPYDSFATVFDGSIAGIEADDVQNTLTIRDNRAKTDQYLIVPSYLGTGGLEGGDDLAGKAKPLCFGTVSNIEPILVDPLNLIYQAHDGAIISVGTVRDSGVLLTSGGDVPDITTATVAAGQFKTQLSGGLIKLGSTPAGRITADLQGTASNTAAAIAQDALTTRLGAKSFGPATMDLGAFARLAAALPGAMGAYYDDRVTASDLIDALLLPCAAYWTFTRQGVLTCGLIDEPGVETVSYDANDIDEDGIQILSSITPSWRISVGYSPLGVIQGENELAGATTDDDRAFLGQGYRIITSENEFVHTTNDQAIERTFLTRLVNRSDAEALLVRLRAIYEAKRRLYRAPIWNGLFRTYIGDTVKLTYPRYGLNAGKNLRVVSVGEDAETGSTTLTLWG